jgi:hypothetical protein
LHRTRAVYCPLRITHLAPGFPLQLTCAGRWGWAAARLWTRGYDLYTVHRNYIWHIYKRQVSLCSTHSRTLSLGCALTLLITGSDREWLVLRAGFQPPPV